MAEAAHAFWSPSGFKQVAACPGSQVLQAGLPDTTSIYAAEGTAAHQLFTWALEQELQASDWLGDKIHINARGRVTPTKADAEWSFEVDEEMAGNVQVAIDYIRSQCGPDDILLVDQRVNFAAYLGVTEDTAWGTLDAAVVQVERNTLVVQDLKYGRGVQVEAGTLAQNGSVEGATVPNDQMALYALGILSAVEEVADIDEVLLVISQPRTQSEPSTFRLSVEELKAWAAGYAQDVVQRAGQAWGSRDRVLAPLIWAATYLNPGEDQCRFCRAKATCPALRAEVADTIVFSAASPDDFVQAKIPGPEFIQPTDAEWLAAALGKVDLIEGWCAAIRAEVERRLLAGQTVPGFKVVAGRQGARTWADPVAAEDLLRKQFRLPIEKAYDLKLISPTTAEKLAKAGDIGPRQWKIAEAQITCRDGKPHVAPVTDKRSALAVTPVADDFDTETEDFS